MARRTGVSGGGKVKVSGGPELKRAFRELGKAVSGQISQDAVRAGAEVVANLARQKVPVGKTGKLKASIQAIDDPRKVGTFNPVKTAIVVVGEFYGDFVELGTSKMAAQPFLRPALDEGATEVEDEIARVLGEGIEREMSKYMGRLV